MFVVAVLFFLLPTIRRVLALVDNRSRTRDPRRRVTERTSELQRALEALEGDKVLELHLKFPLRATGDAERFRMAVEHFLRNANTFSPRRSTIRVEVYDADDHVHVVVSDEGPGVSSDLDLPVAASTVRPPRSDAASELPEPYDLRGVA
jgi:signal transduction histidine kinase